MATIALPRPVPPHRSSSGIPTLGSPGLPLNSLDIAPVPNKHIPVCPHGPVPASPADDRRTTAADLVDSQPQSLLHPPDRFFCLPPDSHDGISAVRLYRIDAADVAAAMDYVACQPLPDPSLVFPWYHGLHPSNHIQQAFFVQRRRALRRTPCCLRGVALVKADGDLSISRLKGAIAPAEILQDCDGPEFLDVDPREGFSVRNFQIQAAKAAMTSDIVVYGDNEHMVQRLGRDIATAQRRWRQRHEAQGHTLPEYNTFVCLASFTEFEVEHPEIVAVDSAGRLTGNVVDLFTQERKEMHAMAAASEISHNVWMGPTPDPATEAETGFDVLIECGDGGNLNPGSLRALAGRPEKSLPQSFVEFPSSGSILPPTYSQAEADGILETCRWIYHLAHGTYPTTMSGQEPVDQEGADQVHSNPTGEDGDEEVATRDVDSMELTLPTAAAPSLSRVPPRKVLIHCQDGYTESTLLGIAYFSFSTGMPVPEAWLKLHTEKRRDFFAYPTDVALLTAIAPRLLSASPACVNMSLAHLTALLSDEPKWLSGLDGSFPSRVMDYMYLGNLGHANNPDLLRALGIGQILSVGETAMWRDGELEEWGHQNVCSVQGVQDNGIDPLTNEIERCLDFIDHGRRNGTATLVHCRVGVSRSATICIAEVMRSMGLSFPRAYSFVRARRLNVIIQPHLRFAYELLKWEELLQARRPDNPSNKDVPVGPRRELEWGEIAREIALMNRPYAR